MESEKRYQGIHRSPYQKLAQSVYEIPVVTVEANNDNHSNNSNEMRDNLDEDGSTSTRGTPIQDFYAGQSIFITGGTGFLGKVLIEKLLRSCLKISTIYLLIRDKKGKNMEERIEDLFNNSFYDRLREVSPKFRHKVVGIRGDCSVRGLGLSSTDRERLLREVSIVFHGAASVRFNEKISTALAINVGGTLDMIDLCKRMDRLKAFIHVSTAFANVHRPRIEESFYSHAIMYEVLEKSLKGLEDREIDKMTPKILNKWPNTYTFTKAIAEVVVKEKSKGLRMGIFRPAIVTSCAYEPIPGWIDNFYGYTGVLTPIISGILRSIHVSPNSRANIVPVDLTVNALIASAWDVANQPDRRYDNMLIYNYVSTVDYFMTWEQCCRTIVERAKEYPLSDAKWAVSLSFHNNKAMSMLGRTFLHYIPALFVDFSLICLGYPPKLIKTYRKIHTFMNATAWCCTNDWTFMNNNVVSMWQRLDAKDQKIFRFSIKDLDWNSYLRNYMKGMRIYLLKDDLSNLEASRKRARRYTRIHETIKALMLTLLFWVLWKTFAAIFF